MFLIKKSTGFDKNIKFKENVNFDKKIKFDEIVKLDKKVKFDKNVKFLHLLPSFGCCISSFSGPKRNFGKPKGSRLYHGIVPVVIWMLNWQHQFPL